MRRAPARRALKRLPRNRLRRAAGSAPLRGRAQRVGGGSIATVTLLVLAPRAAGAGVVAADLGRVAADGVDAVALGLGQVGQVGHRDDQLLDRIVQVLQRMLAVQRGRDFLLLVGLGGQMPVEPGQRRMHRVVLQLGQLREAQGRMLETGHPGHQRLRHRAQRVVAGAGNALLFAGILGQRGRGLIGVDVQHDRVEPAILHQAPVQRGVTALHQGRHAVQPRGVDMLGQLAAVVVEDRRQPFVQLDQPRLHDHATQIAVEHGRIQRVQRRRRRGQQFVEFGELGVGQVLGGAHGRDCPPCVARSQRAGRRRSDGLLLQHIVRTVELPEPLHQQRQAGGQLVMQRERRVGDEHAAAHHAKAFFVGLRHRQPHMQPALLGRGVGAGLQALRELGRLQQLQLRIPDHHDRVRCTLQRLAQRRQHLGVVGLDLVGRVHQQGRAPRGRGQLGLDRCKAVAVADLGVGPGLQIAGEDAVVGRMQFVGAQPVGVAQHEMGNRRRAGVLAQLAVGIEVMHQLHVIGQRRGQFIDIVVELGDAAGVLGVLLRIAAFDRVAAGAGVGVDQRVGLVLLAHVAQHAGQHQVLEDVGMVAGMEGVAVGEHGGIVAKVAACVWRSRQHLRLAQRAATARPTGPRGAA
mmetsp:Transcript_10189/g.19629  ORF Transcript_10189/g.19629 Transcript_10189/m.19629 type:complete len:633 (-) Transcript_10189:93-1991(-)